MGLQEPPGTESVAFLALSGAFGLQRHAGRVPWVMKPVTWDDPNLRWGDPIYLLEPGDPCYVNTAPATPVGGSAKKKGTKTMNETPENQKVLLALAKKIRAGAASLQVFVLLAIHTSSLGNRFKMHSLVSVDFLTQFSYTQI